MKIVVVLVMAIKENAKHEKKMTITREINHRYAHDPQDNSTGKNKKNQSGYELKK